MQNNILEIKNAKFEKTQGGFITLSYNGVFYERVKIIRLFPFTDPDRYLSVRDGNENEIGVIEDLKKLPEETAALIKAQLELYYFTPVIEKIIGIKDEYGYAYFHVMTDRGECKFTINMGANAVSKLTETRLLITDLDGNRFEIPDVLALTVKEQRKLDLFL
ncbi:MAG: DUF1854 domain-containing protein [Eubacteriales bacterium]|nr:DUF1854 domain-containing protein [Eubacteriales bacterium]